MKNMILIMTSILGISAAATANNRATITCTGDNVILVEKSPYLGEEYRQFTQRLFILKSKGSQSKNTAYFLNITEEGATGREIYTGTNEVGGFFQLDVSRFDDVGDGTIIDQRAAGYLDYNHGVLKGKREPVVCTRN